MSDAKPKAEKQDLPMNRVAWDGAASAARSLRIEENLRVLRSKLRHEESVNKALVKRLARAEKMRQKLAAKLYEVYRQFGNFRP
jgi:hypothetical protein